MISEKRLILKNAGRIDPADIGEYLANGGYKSAGKALKMKPDEILEMITQSGLRGRGGAGYPTGLKLRYTFNSQSNSTGRFLICNADEGEPGTFKDRYIIENDPHLVLEGIIIAAHAISASKAYIYLNGEYSRANQLMFRAISDAKSLGFLGANIFGSGWPLDVGIRPGTGAYICGEELSLMEPDTENTVSQETRAPFATKMGLLNDPSLMNNVETLVNLPVIIEMGPQWFSSTGMKGSSGTKLITLTGDVVKKGCFEVEFGATLREIIFDLAGGIEKGKKFKAALIGGTSGTFVSEEALDTRLGYDSLKEAGAVLGSGSIVVMNEDSDLAEITLSLLRFFSTESCGKCIQCRKGYKSLSDGLEAMIASSGKNGFSLDRLIMEAEYMMRTSLCPLSQSPVIPLQSLQRYFRDEFRFDNQVRKYSS